MALHQQRYGPSHAGCMVKLEKIDRSIVRPEDSPQTQSEGIRGHNQIVSDVWDRMLGDEGDQQEEDCYHGDEDASRDTQSLETGSHTKRTNSTHITPFTDRRGYAQWRLRWFGHVQRRDANNVTRRVMELAVTSTRRRGRPKKTWHQQMKEDMTGVGVTQDLALDRKEWRRRTRPTTTR